MPEIAAKPTKGVPVQKRERLWQLEALRGLAALHVLLNHVFNSYLNVRHAIWNFPFRFGQEGVLIFFLLSGFVICYAHGSPGADAGGFRTYLLKRGRRIYPIFIVSILLAYALQHTATHRSAAVDFHSFLGNFFMLQDNPGKAGVFVEPFADNEPLWSLSYEWWFYMMFYPINKWVPGTKQKYLVMGLCAIGLTGNLFIPNSVFNFLVLFPIWWAGVELAREFLAKGDVTFRRQRGMLLLLAGPAGWYGWQVLQRANAGYHLSVIQFPFMGFRYFFMAGAFILLAFAWKHWKFAGYRQTIGQFEWIGSISYAVYLFHYPLICDLRLFAGTTNLIFYADLFLRIVIAFVLAWLAERHLQKWINCRTARWVASPAKN